MFIDNEKEQVTNLKATFVWFEAVSGLYANLGKSVVYGIKSALNLSCVADMVGCRVRQQIGSITIHKLMEGLVRKECEGV